MHFRSTQMGQCNGFRRRLWQLVRIFTARWEGYDKKDDTWEPITHLQGYATMVKAFKESHAKDVEKLAADRVREAEKKNRFPICLMTNSVRKASFSIGLGVCQGTLMSTRRTLTSLGCGDSSMVTLHLEAA